ncbi:hypothetical protein [Sodalis sp. dw_96]|uniref:hypothetical protein n=1 Tax=Sodalis sp. dw_96 TaxID=2719794 RepID=UPI001BD60C70|nr:hypothetical protein [Sodalis sp. dw_96]
MNVTPLDLLYNYPSDSMGTLVLKDGDKVLNTLQFQRSLNTELSELGATLSQVSNTPQKISKGNVDLAGYLYALSTAGEMPSCVLIAELTRCNASVNQARENLKNGRANIMSDFIARPQLGREIAFIRTKEINGFSVENDVTIHASSMYLSLGNCREIAIHTAIVHSQNCQGDEIVKRMVSEKIDHAWAESRNCVMDSWAHGPAVLKEDVGSIDVADGECLSFNKEKGRKFLEDSAELLKVLEVLGKNGEKLKAEIESNTYITLKFRPKISVINDRLKELINVKRQATTHTQLRGVNNQIRATGVLRSLAAAMGKGISIKEATDGSDHVINAFNNRFLTGYLDQWRSE